MNTTLKTSFTAALPRARLAVRSFVGAQASIWTKRRVIAIVAPQFLISVLLLLASGRAVWATTYTWASGVNGAWSDAADWTPSGGPPGPNDTAVISSGTVTVGSAVTVAEAIMSGGTLTGSPVTVTGPFYWSGGDIENTVQFYGGTNGGYCYLDGGKIINEGTWDWNGTIYDGAGSVISNAPSGTMDLENLADSQTFYFTYYNVTGSHAFYNAGEVNAIPGAGATGIIEDTLINSGTIESGLGTLNLATGGTNSANIQTTTALANLELSGGAFLFNNTSDVSVNGNLIFAGGTVTVEGIVTVLARIFHS